MARNRHRTPTNGHPATPAPLLQLREQVEAAELRARLAQAEAQAAVAESVVGPLGWGGAWGDLANPYGYRRDDGGNLWLPLASGSLYSRQQGRNRPFAWADIDLDAARSLARWLATKNDVAIGALKAIRNFTIKTGYKWEARPSAGNENSPAAIRLAGAVQRLIDGHSDLNNLPARERSACWRAVRDGEAFTRHFAQPGGATLVRFVEPEQVREQAPAGHDPNGAFGVVTAPGDVEDVRAYTVTYDGSEYEEIDARDVCHLKRNVDECVKRGLSDFFSSGDSLDQVAKLLRNMAVSGAAQAAIAWTEQFKAASQSQVASHVAGIRDLNRSPMTGPVSGRDLNYQKLEPGTVRKVGEGMEQVPPPVPVGASVHIQIVQASLRAVGCRWNMPEYMVSGDSSGANFAGTLVAGSPFVNAVECEQDDFGLFFLRWRWLAVRNACEAGLFGDYTFAQVQELIDIHYTPPQVAVAKEAEQATIDHQDIAAGVMSLQTRRARRGLDDEQERRNLKEEPLTRVQGRTTDLDAQGNPRKPGTGGEGTGGAGAIRPDLPKPAPPGSADGAPAEDPFARLLGESRQEGDVWQGESGRWFTLRNGRPVPAEHGGDRVAEPVGQIASRQDAVGKALEAAGGLAAATKAAASRLGEKAWNALDADEQAIFAKAYAVGAWLAHHAEAAMRGGKAWAVEAAKERGLSEEQAARVARVVGVADAVAAWTVNVPAATLATGNPLAGKAAGFVPVASMAYLAYSTARNPLAVLRAAKAAVKAARATHESVGPDERAAVAALADGIKGAADPDWLTALTLAALDDAGGLGGAVEVAARAATESAAPVSESRLAEEFDSAKHPRGHAGNRGQFAKKGQGGSGGTADAPDPDAGRPSHPDRRHAGEGGQLKRPKALPWKAPPPKAGKAGQGMAARPRGDDSQTKIGDLGEALATRLGFRSILPTGRRAHRPGENEDRGSTIDLEFDHSGRAYELKLCNTSATEYRLKAKAKEKEQKLKFAGLHGLTPHVLVGVRDVETGEVHFYAGREPGLHGAEVSEKTFDFVGSVRP